MSYQGCSCGYGSRTHGLCYYRHTMKYIGYLILAYTTGTFAALSKVLDDSYGLPGSTIKSGAGMDRLKTFFSSIVTTLQDIAAIAGVLGICIVGIMYVMSMGDEEKTENAKKYMMAIFIGIIIAFTAYAVIAMIDLVPNSITF